MQGLMLLRLLASAKLATYAWAALASVAPASDLAANGTTVMAKLVTNVTAAEPVEYWIPGTT